MVKEMPFETVSSTGRPRQAFGEEKHEPFLFDIKRHPVTEDTRFTSPRIMRLLTWWRGFRDEMPRRGQFDIIDFIDLAPYICLVEALDPECRKFRFRVKGEIPVEIVGPTDTELIFGLPGTGYDSPEHGPLAQYFNDVLTSRQPWRCHGVAQRFGVTRVALETIDLPLADKRGQPRYSLGLMDVLGRQEEIGAGI